MADYVIIGSGIAGHAAAVEFARRAPQRSVCMLERESGPSYDRPPLSKKFLLTPEAAPVYLPTKELASANFERRDSTSAVSINRQAKTVSVSDGLDVSYEKLLIATGARCRQISLPNVDAERVFYLRTLEDAERLRRALHGVQSVAIIGGGFIGLEVAAAARQRGCTVTLLEMRDALLSRSCTRFASEKIEELHRRDGVNFLFGQTRIRVRDLGDGLEIDSDAGSVRVEILVIGIGVEPNTDLASTANLHVEDGIIVDAWCRTSDEAIFAAGDVARYPVERLGVTTRSESWTASSLQGAVAARNMLGDDTTYSELPWFWSDQYDVTFQSVGFPALSESVFRIEKDARSWLRFGVDREGFLVGAEGIGMERQMAALRRADRTGRHVPADVIEQAEEEVTPIGASA